MDKPKTLIVSSEDLQAVKDILQKIIPKYQVWAFGSRVGGKPRKHSDLDLVVLTTTPLEFDLFSKLKNNFSESTLPFKVDLVDWASLESSFQNVIKQNYLVIQEGN